MHPRDHKLIPTWTFASDYHALKCPRNTKTLNRKPNCLFSICIISMLRLMGRPFYDFFIGPSLVILFQLCCFYWLCRFYWLRVVGASTSLLGFESYFSHALISFAVSPCIWTSLKGDGCPYFGGPPGAAFWRKRLGIRMSRYFDHGSWVH